MVLPPVEVHVGFEIRLPRILDGGLKGNDEHPPGVELFSQLVRGERLAEAHLRVPEKARYVVRVVLPDRVEVGVRLLDSLGLLAAHREGLVVSAAYGLARAQFGEHGPHVRDRAAHPLQLGVGVALSY